MRRAWLLALGLLLLAATPADGAVTRTQATKIAKRAVRGDTTNASQMYGFRRPLARGSVVTEGGIPNRLLRRAKRRGNTLRARVPAVRLRRPAWIFWHEPAPGAGFQHPSTIVLVDALSGRARERHISWWPVVNRKRLLPPGVRPVRRRAVPPAAWSAAFVPGLRNDCIVTIGDRTDPYFTKGLAAVTRMGNSIGVPVAAAGRVRDLLPKIDELARRDPPCTDVMIYIAAHGWAPPGSDAKLANGQPVGQSQEARVTIKSTVTGGASPVVEEEFLEVSEIRGILRSRPNLTFKLVVESCFSGRWTSAMAEPNLRVTLTSSRTSEVTFLAVTHAQAGRQTGGQLEWNTDAPVGEPDAEGDPPPFTNGLTQAVDQWSESAEERAKGEDLGEALGYAGTHREGDRARALGWQHGQTDDRTDRRPHATQPSAQPPPSQPPGQVAYEVGVDGSWRHMVGESEVCWDIRTVPPRPNAEVTVNTTGVNVKAGASQTVRTDANGFVRVRVLIGNYGGYHAEVQVVAPDGAARDGRGDVTVTEEPGTCPPP
ncbi:MAG TPA: hypothetical protein VF529_22595 [Solirubrobacteraceae bacterium]|jgi:hypothetical protein